MFRNSLNLRNANAATRMTTFVKIAQLAFRVLLISALVAGPLRAAASVQQQIEQQVTAQALDYLSQKYPQTEIDLTLTPVNPNLNLPLCGEPLEVRFPYDNPQRLTARVSCNTPQSWSIFVSGRIDLWRQVVVAKQPIAKGTQIRTQMLGFGRTNLTSRRADYFTELTQIAGQTSRRDLAHQQPITTQDLEPSVLVKRGEEVILESVRGGARISVKAIALEDGLLGEQIKVKNQQSGRELVGRVIGLGQVRSN